MDFSSKINSVQVQEPPSWIIKPFDIKGPELDKVEFKCQALGSPPAKYTWVDKEGIDATEKEGKKSGHNFVWIVSLVQACQRAITKNKLSMLMRRCIYCGIP